MTDNNLSKNRILGRRILVGLAGGLTMGTLASSALIALWALAPAVADSGTARTRSAADSGKSRVFVANWKQKTIQEDAPAFAGKSE